MKTEVATLAGGCYWCVEAIFEQLQGVEGVVSGFSGGHVKNPAYREVCEGTTGHAEVVQVRFDPAGISYREILDFFFAFHDPTTLDRQGPDAGTQYRSAIFFHSPEQETAAREAIAHLTQDGVFGAPIVTEVNRFDVFYPADLKHQGYYRANSDQPYCQAVITPKVTKLRQKYAARLKSAATPG
ncbi:MAG: peptide-methionine (S)-S-oxide reductase MsrA [Candidatus Eisenbacteria bacterium]